MSPDLVFLSSYVRPLGNEINCDNGREEIDRKINDSKSKQTPSVK